MKVPNIIELGSHKIEVILDGFQEDKVFRGTFSPRGQRMLLNPKLPHQQLRVTFLHELVHLICDVDDIELSEQDTNRLAESLGDILFRCFGLDLDFSEIKLLERQANENSGVSDKH